MPRRTRTRKRTRTRTRKLRGGNYRAKLTAAAGCLENHTNAFKPLKGPGPVVPPNVVGPFAATQSGGNKFATNNANFPFGDIAPLSTNTTTANCDVPRKAYVGQVNKGVGGRRKTRKTRKTKRRRRSLKGGSYILGYKTTPTWKNVAAQSNQPGLRNEIISAVQAGDKKFSAFVKPFRTIGPGHPANIYGDLQAYNFSGVGTSAFSGGGRRRRRSSSKKSKGKRKDKGKRKCRIKHQTKRAKRRCSSCH